ncbi:leucine-rich repeat protein [Xylocopilactobacillus apicola]|uniref:Ig-like domain-containing protein n=1 Tax=Xylocopilactobacillus apicola TaxID=2932184 RepID=A0AAU9DTS5_9LACO|nr:leucine-rich repeat protein [Xylocopilactobacillus apicola]BDR59569.1 hypothetical protein XA3_20100 [Xylocopilactobacillus apicola]
MKNRKILVVSSTIIFSILLVFALLHGFTSYAGNQPESSHGEQISPSGLLKTGQEQFTFDNFDNINFTCRVVKYNGTDPEVTIPDTVTQGGNTYKVTTTGDVFSANPTIQTITTGQYMISVGVGTDGYFAANCPNLKTVNLNEGLTTIRDYSLQNNPKLENINFPSTLTYIGTYAFSNDPALTTLNFPANLQGIGKGAFQSCTGLTTINFPSNSKLNMIEYATFAYCYQLQGTLEIPASVTQIGREAFYSAFQRANSQLVFAPGSALTYIGESAFAYASYLGGNLLIPKNVTEISTSAFGGAFQNGGPTTLTFEANSTLQTIGDQAFWSANRLAGIVNIPPSVTSIGTSAFSSCFQDSPSQIIFAPGSALTTIGSSAFAYCNRLEGDLLIPKNVTSIGDNAFSLAFQSAGDATLTFEAPSQIKTIGMSAFSEAKKLKGDLILPEGLLTIGQQAFMSTSFTSVKFPTTLAEIPVNGFSYTYKMQTVEIPGSVKKIGANAFYSSTLKNLTLNPGLEVIGPLAFAFTRFPEVIIPSTVTEIGHQAFWAGKLEKVVIPSAAKLGDLNYLYDAFSWNSIWSIEMDPVNAPIGIGNQTFNGQSIYKHFVYQSDIPVDDLFNVHVDGTDQAKRLRFSNLTNGVTYSNGSFHIPASVSRFTFNFDGYITSAGQEDKPYNGIYTVDFGNSRIRVRDLIVIQGSTWQPIDNFISAVDAAGNDLPFSALTVNPTSVNTNVIGTYPVTYSHLNDSAVANVIVTKSTTPTSTVKVNYYLLDQNGNRTTTPVPGAPNTSNINGFVGLNWNFVADHQIHDVSGDYELVGSSDPAGNYTVGLDAQNGTFEEDTGVNPQINFYYALKTALFFNGMPDLDFGKMHNNGSTNALANGPKSLKFHVGSAAAHSQISAQMSKFKPVGHGGPDVVGTMTINASGNMVVPDGYIETPVKPLFSSTQLQFSSTDGAATVLFDNLTSANQGNWAVNLASSNTKLTIPRLGSAGKYQAKMTWTIVNDQP